MKGLVINMKGVWVATMESEHYAWKAVGLTKEEARDAIAKEWNEGTGNERRDSMTLQELEEYYGIRCEFIGLGKCIWC